MARLTRPGDSPSGVHAAVLKATEREIADLEIRRFPLPAALTERAALMRTRRQNRVPRLPSARAGQSRLTPGHPGQIALVSPDRGVLSLGPETARDWLRENG